MASNAPRGRKPVKAPAPHGFDGPHEGIPNTVNVARSLTNGWLLFDLAFATMRIVSATQVLWPMSGVLEHHV